MRRQSGSRDRIFHFHFPAHPCTEPFPAGTEPVHSSAIKAAGTGAGVGRGRVRRREGRKPAPRRGSPCFSRPEGIVSFPAVSSARRRLSPLSALPPAPVAFPAAMLRRCPPVPPGPPPLRRSLPPTAPAVRRRLREVGEIAPGFGGGGGGRLPGVMGRAAVKGARLSLQCAGRIPEAGAVLDLLEKCPEHQEKGGFPVVVFEGLDATGKRDVWGEGSQMRNWWEVQPLWLAARRKA